MRRRMFIAGLGGTVATGALAFAARAQQPVVPVVGFLRSGTLASGARLVPPFRQGLREQGFIEGQNVMVEYLSADGQTDRLPALVENLLRRPVAVIVANQIAAHAAKALTKAVPIVFASGGDPIKVGLVKSLNRPGGNLTGVNFFAGSLGTKRLQLLRQFVPNATIIGVIVNPNTIETEAERTELMIAARTIGQKLIILDVGGDRDIETAFATFVQRGVGAVFVGTGVFTADHRGSIVALAARHALPAIYHLREAVEVGGLISYGTNIRDAYRQVGIYTGRILKGEKPADLPVVQATKFELVINLKTAKALGLEFHPQLLAIADEVIE